MSVMASRLFTQDAVYSGADQRKHQSSASLAFVTGESPAQRASTAEKFSTWWRHHVSTGTRGEELGPPSRDEYLAAQPDVPDGPGIPGGLPGPSGPPKETVIPEPSIPPGNPVPPVSPADPAGPETGSPAPESPESPDTPPGTELGPPVPGSYDDRPPTPEELAAAGVGNGPSGPPKTPVIPNGPVIPETGAPEQGSPENSGATLGPPTQSRPPEQPTPEWTEWLLKWVGVQI